MTRANLGIPLLAVELEQTLILKLMFTGRMNISAADPGKVGRNVCGVDRASLKLDEADPKRTTRAVPAY